MNSPPEAEVPSFTVVVSEKGGAERRQTFDTTELNVGRVQGNELMLPKGNVSKRHARLLFRDGRFIVTDLNSTNGTYVNRRRIAQATIVREGDRIYIGDFVLRIELNATESFDDKTGNTGRPSFSSVHEGPSVPDSAPKLQSQDQPSYSDELTQTPGVSRDSDGPTPNRLVVERPPRPDAEGLSKAQLSADDKSFTTAAARHRAAVHRVVSHVLSAVGEASLGPDFSDELAVKVRELAAEKAESLARAHELPEGLSAEGAADSAVLELLDLGPLGALLSDSAVTGIAVPRYDHLSVTRGGRQVPLFPTFSCAWSLNTALERLARRAQVRLSDSSSTFDFGLPDGTRISGVRGDAAPTGTLLVVRKPRRIGSSLEKLVRRGAISRALATFLNQCVLARLNLLVVGPRDEGALTLLSALAGACSPDHVVALSGIDDVVAHTEAATRLSIEEAGQEETALLKVAAGIPEARLVVTLSSSQLAVAAVEAIGDGIDGVMACLRSPDLRRALSRLPADLTIARPGLTLEAAREWVKSSFDVLIEVARMRDGRIRVLRVAEFATAEAASLELSDIFRFVVERMATGGAIEGSFVTCDRPAIADRLSSIGIELESSLFSRTQSR